MVVVTLEESIDEYETALLGLKETLKKCENPIRYIQLEAKIELLEEVINNLKQFTFN